MAPVKTLSLATRTATRRLKLRHVGRDRLTIARRRADEGYTYHAADGTQITDAVMLKRFASLAVPPAYEEVYFCPDEQAHLQAVGRDAAGRLQYRYHRPWLRFCRRYAAPLPSTSPAPSPHATSRSPRRSSW